MNNIYRRSLLEIFLWIILIPGLVAGGVWLNLQMVTLNPQDAFFVTYWVSTRAFFFEGESPYADMVTQQTQQQIYGRLARSGEETFVAKYPLYATVLFAPFALINDYALARAAWMLLLEICLLITLYASLRLTEWKPPGWLVISFALFAMIWVHGLLPVLNGDVVIIATLMLVLALLALRSERYEWAGILLALSTLQLFPLLLAVIFILVWSLSRRVGVVLLFFLGTVVLLLALGMFFSPDWPLQYLRIVLRQPIYLLPDTLGGVLTMWWPGVGRQVGWVLTGILSLMLLVEWWLALRRDFRWMLWTCCLTLILGTWVGIPTSPMAFGLLLLPLVLGFATWNERAPLVGRVLAILVLLALSGGLWPLVWNGRPTYPWPQIPPTLFLPAPALLLLFLYWVRWWAVRPRRFFEDLNAHQDR